MILAESSLLNTIDSDSLQGNSIAFSSYVRLWNIMMKLESNIYEV